MKQAMYFIIFLLLCLPTGRGLLGQELSLSAAIEQALANNYGLSISRANLEIAKVNNHWGNAGKYPSVGFDASLNNSYDLADQSTDNRIAAGIGLDWVLFDGFRVRISKNILENTEDLSSGRLAIIIENTIEDVILYYYSVLLEQERLSVLKTVMDLSTDRYNYELQKKELGSSLTYAVLQAENVYLSDKASFLEQEMRVRNAIRNLNFIMAEDPLSSWTFTEDFQADTTHFILADLQTKMLDNNQTLKNQYTHLLMKKEEIRLKESAYYPSLSTSAGMDNSISRNKTASSSPQNYSSYSPYANLRLSYDIYSGGVRKRAVEVAKINQQITESETAQIEHSLNNELFSLFDYHEVRISLLDVADKSLNAAELNLKISEEKYRSGVINSFNYRDVQLMFLEASLRRLQAIYNLIDSRTKLTRLTGGYLQVKE